MLTLEIAIVILAILTYVFFNQGGKVARQYGYRKNIPRRKKPSRIQQVPIKFSADSILRAGRKFGKNGKSYFAFDTDVLIENPTILNDLSEKYKVELLISEQVRYELNKVKDRKIDISDQARYVLKVIERLHKDHKLEIVPINKALMRKYSLKPEVQDDLVIGSYLEKVNLKDVIFITNDNNARTTARMTDLKPLELDWEVGKKLKEKEFRPGFTFRVLAIISFSLAVGVYFGIDYMKTEIGASPQIPSMLSKIADDESEEKKTDKIPKVFKSEYGDEYKARKNGDWGVSAIIDQEYIGQRGFFSNYDASIKVLFVAYNTEDVDDKSNELTFQLETADGQIFEASYYRVYEYDEEKGIYVDSVDSNIKFDGANSYESTKIDVDDLTEEDLKGSKLILIHKVTEEVVQTFEL